MSAANRLFGTERPMGVVEAVKEGLKEGVALYAKGVKEVVETAAQGIGEAATRLVPHGASELAAALFSGNANAYVMYQHTGKHDQPEQQQQLPQQQQQSRGQSM